MVGLTALWLPILLSAVFVFLVSAILHMGLRYHRTDFSALPGEDNVAEAMRKEKIGPGDYCVPHCTSMKAMGSPEMQAKFEKGPVGFLTILPSGPPNMGKSLVQWFLYSIVVSFVAAYVVSRTLEPGTDYLQVFRVSGTAAFLAYAGGEPIESIWKGRKWSTTFKNVFDGFVYSLMTGGAFGWLWPH